MFGNFLLPFPLTSVKCNVTYWSVLDTEKDNNILRNTYVGFSSTVHTCFPRQYRSNVRGQIYTKYQKIMAQK